MHSVTDRQTDRETDDRMMPIADHNYCVAVRSANKIQHHNREKTEMAGERQQHIYIYYEYERSVTKGTQKNKTPPT